MSDVSSRMDAEAEQKPPAWVDLLQCCQNATGNGPEWAHECEDLDMTLLTWDAGRHIAPHVNDEVDVVLIGVAGKGEVTVNGEAHEMRAGVALLIPKGAERSIRAVSERFGYLSLHRRRRRLMPTLNGKRIE